MAMNSFRLYIRLQTPIQLGRFPVRLDGLLWHTLYCHYGCPKLAAERLPEFLETETFEGNTLYRAGCLRFGVLGEIPSKGIVDNLIGLTATRVGNMRDGSDLSPRAFKPNRHGGKKYKTVNTSGGAYKTAWHKNQVYFSNFLVFDGCGKGDAIADLLDFYVPAIGVNANNGYGTIGGVIADKTTQDASLINETGNPARPLPVNAFAQLSARKPMQTGNAILSPPFRDQPEVLCALPERISKLFINNPGV